MLSFYQIATWLSLTTCEIATSLLSHQAVRTHPDYKLSTQHWYNSATALLQVVHHSTSEHKITKALEVRDFVFRN
jgi:hypothetical protein